MRILYVSAGAISLPPSKGGGIEAYICNVARELAARGHEVTVLDRARGGIPSRVTGAVVVQISAPNLPILSIFGLQLPPLSARVHLDQVAFGFGAGRYLKQNASRFDVVVINHTTVAIGVLWARPDPRPGLVYTSHSSRRFSRPASLVDRAAVRLEAAVASRVDATVVGSGAARHALVAGGIPQERVAAIATNTVDPEALSATRSGSVDPFEALGVPSGLRLLYVGRLRPNKGVSDLVRALGLLSRPLQGGTHAVIVGPGEEFGRPLATSPYAASVLRIARSVGVADHVHMTGDVELSTLRQLLLSADVFVLPSHSESSPRVLTEAMAAGRAVVATRIPGVEDQVTHEFNGLLYPPTDHHALAGCISRLAASPALRERLGQEARRTVQTHHSWDAAVPRIERVLSGAVGPRAMGA